MIPQSFNSRAHQIQEEHEGSLSLLMRQDDAVVANLVRDRLPVRTYTCVNVASLDNYSFMGINTKPTRLISLTVAPGTYCSSFFYAFFSGIGLIESPKLEGRIDNSNLQNQLLSHICGSPGEVDQIEKAYARCTDIDLYIASDLSAIEMKVRESSVILGVYNIARVARTVLPVLVPLVLGNANRRV